MSDTVFVFILATTLLSVPFIWMPLLHTAEIMARDYPRRQSSDMPNLTEEDSGPQFTGEVV